MELIVEVICTNLPGSRFVNTRGVGAGTYDGVQLGIQQGESPVQSVPGDRAEARFEAAFRVAPLPDGTTNFLGPFAKGTQRERFFYLSWTFDHAGMRAGFRRLKVHLSHLPWDRVEEAARAGKPIRVELSMTDRRGEPWCGSARAEQVRWHV